MLRHLAPEMTIIIGKKSGEAWVSGAIEVTSVINLTQGARLRWKFVSTALAVLFTLVDSGI